MKQFNVTKRMFVTVLKAATRMTGLLLFFGDERMQLVKLRFLTEPWMSTRNCKATQS